MSKLVDGVGVAGVGIYGGRYHPVTPERSDPERAKQQQSAKPREMTTAEVADWYLAAHEREQQQRADRERQREAEQEAHRQRNRAQREAQQAEERKQNARRQWEANERLIDGVFAQNALTPEEVASVCHRMIDAGRYNIEGALYFAAEAVAARPQPHK